jgi:cysteine desulfurase/selenocysteine lyase
MLGPSGVGVLWAKRELLEEMNPLFVGSNMISTVSKSKAAWADLPDKFEVGTPNLEGVIGLGAAIDFLNNLGMKNIERHERKLSEYTLEVLQQIKGVKLFGKSIADNRLGVFSFAIGNIHSHDIGEILSRKQICVRSGHHCAQPLMRILKVYGTARASIYLYNNKDDIDRLAEGILEVKRIFKIN